ncbi:MAG TPA: putative sulfate exporter family transporter [Polyangia bacterium]
MSWRDHAGDVALVAAFAACLLLPIAPAVALAGGAALALSLGHRRAALTGRWTRRLLQWSVVGLGAGMDLGVVARVGLHGLVYTVVGIAATLTLGAALGRWLRLPKRSALLVSLGTAICGGSAIAAAAPVLEADSEETSVALATVFLLNGVALFLFPAIGHALHLSQSSFGLWAALAIHDTSSVVGAGLAFGPAALATATAVKLARALWIAPTTAALGWRRGRARAKVPLFIVGFIAAAALGTFVAPIHAIAPIVSAGARHVLVASLFLVGAGLSRTALRKTGMRPLVHGTLLWMAVGSLTLLAIVRGWIR